MRLRAHLLAYLFYLVIAVIVTYPLVTVLGTRFAGHPVGDTYEYVHHIWWFKTALQTGQDPFFQPNIVYPDGASATVVWSLPLQSFPAWLLAFALPLPAAFNLQFLLTLALNGWAMFVLARYLLRGATASTAPALLAGLVFMLYPAFQGHWGAAHVGLLSLYPVPLYVYALFRLREYPSETGHSDAVPPQKTHYWRWILIGAFLFAASLWGGLVLLIYLVAPLTALFLLMLMIRREWQALKRTLVTLMLGGVFAAPFVVPLVLDTSVPREDGAVTYSASLLGIVSPSFYHPLFSGWEYNRRVLGVDPFEQASYIGLIAAAIALVGVWKARAARWWLLLALAAWVFSLGPLLKVFDQPQALRIDGYATNISLPWALFQSLPLLNIARTPARFNFAVGFAVSVLVGYGAAYLWERARVREAVKWGALALLMLVVAFEYQFWWGLPTVSGEVPAPVAALAERADLRAVLDVPGYHLLANKDGMFLQTGHHLPMIVGQIARRSPADPAKVVLLQNTLDPALLNAEGVDIVIVHREYDLSDGYFAALARERLGEPIYEDVQIAVFETPRANAMPEFMSLPASAETITTQADSYVYAPNDGWVTFSAQLISDAPRDVKLLLDGVTVQRWTVDGMQEISSPLPVDADSFHTITVALDPACPEHFDATLECRSVGLANVTLDYTSAEVGEPVTFERGVTLARVYFPAAAEAGQNFAVWLWWQFDEPRAATDTRFVHITNAKGELVGQQDVPLEEIPAGETRAETVEITLPDDLPPGEYTVSAGWYTYPEMVNFCVLVNGVCSGNAATLGTFTVEQQ